MRERKSEDSEEDEGDKRAMEKGRRREGGEGGEEGDVAVEKKDEEIRNEREALKKRAKFFF